MRRPSLPDPASLVATLLIGARLGTNPPKVEALATDAPPAKAHDPSRPTAVIVAGNTGAEITDLLPPYELLAATGAFNLYVVAPERRPLPLITGLMGDSGLDLLPDLSLAAYDALGALPDLVVVPFIPWFRRERALLGWLSRNAGLAQRLLTICGGSAVLAASGAIDGRTVTSHHSFLGMTQRAFPHVRVVGGSRWIESRNLISSGGLAAGIDATLATLERILGPEAAARAVAEARYAHGRFLRTPAHEPAPWRFTKLPRKQPAGILLADGVAEADLAALADTSAMTLEPTVGVGFDQAPVRSLHGLHFRPRRHLGAGIDRLLIPRGRRADAIEAAARRAPGSRIEALDGAGYAYDLALSSLARRRGRSVAAAVAGNLVYPADHLDLRG